MEFRSKFTEPVSLTPLYKETQVVLHVPNDHRGDVLTALSGLKFSPESEYTVTIKPYKAKRGLSANAYAWTLIGRIAEVVRLPALEVYRSFIRDMYTFTPVDVDEAYADAIIDQWSRNGATGWIAEDCGPCNDRPGSVWSVPVTAGL